MSGVHTDVLAIDRDGRGDAVPRVTGRVHGAPAFFPVHFSTNGFASKTRM
jgi:hypothetical protein